jgi:hypothetical protein
MAAFPRGCGAWVNGEETCVACGEREAGRREALAWAKTRNVKFVKDD